MKKFNLLFFIWCLFSLPVSAAGNTVTLHLEQTKQDVVFQIMWENREQEAEIEILSPSGEKFGNKLTPNTTSETEGNVMVNVGPGTEGDWKVNLRGTGLGEVTVSAGTMPDNLQIDDFQVQENSNSYRFNWKISGSSQDKLKIGLYADTDGSGYDGTCLNEFEGDTSGSAEVRKEKVNNGVCFFYIKAEGSAGIFQYEYASQAFYCDSGNAEELSGLQVCVINKDVCISWEEAVPRTAVLMFDSESLELIQKTVLEETPGYLPFPEDVTRMKVGVARCDEEGMITGPYRLYEASQGVPKDASVLFPEAASTNQRTTQVEVKFAPDCSMTASVNDEILLDEVQETGAYNINLQDGSNEIVIFIQDKEGNGKTFRKEIYVDTTPPQLSVSTELDQTVTSEKKVYLEGYSEAGAALSCNGETVQMVGSYFSIPCKLNYGKNKLILRAEDAAGNAAEYSAVVTRKFWNSKMAGTMVLAGIGLTLFLIYAVTFIRGTWKKRKSR